MKLQRVHGKIHIGPWDEVKALCEDKTFGRLEARARSVGILDVADDVPEYPPIETCCLSMPGLTTAHPTGRHLGGHITLFVPI